jgi:hypothetical protein
MRRPLASIRSLQLALSLAAVVIVAACSPTPTSGTLAITVNGLAAGSTANITIGTIQVTGSTSLTLAAGAYQIIAAPVLADASIMGDRLAPDEDEIDITVTAGQTTTVTITYTVTQQALLLAPNYGSGTIEVLTIDDLVPGGVASSSWSTDVSNGYTGLAYGPDGRLYLADYSNDAIVVVDAADLASDGTVTPAAVITHAGLAGPMGGAFDSNGSLWVASYSDDTVLRFDGVVGASGPTDLAPALVLTVDDSGGAAAFGSIYDVFVDHLDNVWIADYDTEAIYRFEDVATLSGAQALVPDLYLTYISSATSDSGYSLYYPISLVVDLEGTLYVANYDYEVSRFDDALSLTGAPDVEASAYLDTGIDYNYMLALDQSGALWIGHYYGELARLPEPASYMGYADVSGDLDLLLSWLSAGGSGYPDGGTLKFVPTQGPLAGY